MNSIWVGMWASLLLPALAACSTPPETTTHANPLDVSADVATIATVDVVDAPRIYLQGSTGRILVDLIVADRMTLTEDRALVAYSSAGAIDPSFGEQGLLRLGVGR